MIAHPFESEPFGRDTCNRKLDEGDGKARMCGYKRREHEIPQEAMKRGDGTLRHVEPAQVPTPGSFAGLENREEVIAKPCTSSEETARPLVYLACPYTHRERAVRLARFEAANLAAANLMAAGHKVFSPISHTHPIAEAGALPLGWDFWEAYDRAFLAHSSRVFVLRIDGWQESRGVQGELRIAAEMGIPVEFVDPVVEEIAANG